MNERMLFINRRARKRDYTILLTKIAMVVGLGLVLAQLIANRFPTH